MKKCYYCGKKLPEDPGGLIMVCDDCIDQDDDAEGIE